MALYSKEIKRAQDKLKSGKSTKITTKKAEKTPKLRGAYEVASTTSKPKKKKVVVETKTVTRNLPPQKRTKNPMGVDPKIDKAIGTASSKPKTESRRSREEGRANRRRQVKTAPFGMKTVAGRAMLDDAGKKELAKRKARRQAVIRERSPVTTETLHDSWGASTAIADTKRREQAAEAARLKREAKEREEVVDDGMTLLAEKTGGKVSRKKGGTVSRKAGGTVWNGNSEVSKWYDM